jgi:hypothetical protein
VRLTRHLSPNILERLWRHCGVAHRIRNRGVAQKMLKPPRIHASVRQRIAGAVPEHVDVHCKRQLSENATSSAEQNRRNIDSKIKSFLNHSCRRSEQVFSTSDEQFASSS